MGSRAVQRPPDKAGRGQYGASRQCQFRVDLPAEPVQRKVSERRYPQLHPKERDELGHHPASKQNHRKRHTPLSPQKQRQELYTKRHRPADQSAPKIQDRPAGRAAPVRKHGQRFAQDGEEENRRLRYKCQHQQRERPRAEVWPGVAENRQNVLDRAIRIIGQAEKPGAEA